MNNSIDLVYSMHVNASNEAKKYGETTYVLSNLKIQQITKLSAKTIYNLNYELFKKHLIRKDPSSTKKCLIYQVIEKEGVPFQVEKRNLENPTPKYDEIIKYQAEIDALKKKLDIVQAESDAKSVRLTNAEKEYRKLRFENTQLKSQVSPTSTVKSLFPIDSELPKTNNLPNMEEFYNNLTDEEKTYYDDFVKLGEEMMVLINEKDTSKIKDRFFEIAIPFDELINKMVELKTPHGHYPFENYLRAFQSILVRFEKPKELTKTEIKTFLEDDKFQGVSLF